MKPSSSLLCCVVCAVVALSASAAAQPTKIPEPGEFVVALATAPDGALWVGTEDRGVFRSSDDGKTWTQYTVRDGLGDDNAYAICIDRKQRVWVGHQRSGLSVFDGDSWRNYDTLDGPIGERIFDLACSPADGDVWAATSAGLSRWEAAEDRWLHYTRAHGLPGERAVSLAFNRRGRLWAAFETAGVAVAAADGPNLAWRSVPCAPLDEPPLVARGAGLPSPLANRILVARDGAVYVATCTGLAWSIDGASFQYLRGRDFADKVEKRMGGPPKNWSRPKDDVLASLLPADYVTGLAEDRGGGVWLGFRQAGCVRFDPRSGQLSPPLRPAPAGAAPNEDVYVQTLLVDAESRLWSGGYGGGLWKTLLPAPREPRPRLPAGPAPLEVKGVRPPFPSKARPVELADGAAPTVKAKRSARGAASAESSIRAVIRETTEALRRAPSGKAASGFFAIELDDDWRTRGDWTDRYGRFACVFGAMAGGGSDLYGGYQGAEFHFRGWIGPNHPQPNDCIRRWVHERNAQDRRVLQNPNFGGRTQAELDDHKEAGPLALDGPHVYGSFVVPPGDYLLSSYFFNKDGHSGKNRIRDYLIEVRETPMPFKEFDRLYDAGREATAVYYRRPAAARSRVREFWGGVYKRFYLHVPPQSCTTLHVNANHSFNTLLSSVFLDRLNPERPRNEPPQRDLDDPAAGATVEELVTLAVERLDLARRDAPAWYFPHRRRLALPVVQAWLAAERRDSGEDRDGQAERRKASLLLEDLGRFEDRDRVYFPRKSFETFAWRSRNKLGSDWKWDQQGFQDFITAAEEAEARAFGPLKPAADTSEPRSP